MFEFDASESAQPPEEIHDWLSSATPGPSMAEIEAELVKVHVLEQARLLRGACELLVRRGDPLQRALFPHLAPDCGQAAGWSKLRTQMRAERGFAQADAVPFAVELEALLAGDEVAPQVLARASLERDAGFDGQLLAARIALLEREHDAARAALEEAQRLRPDTLAAYWIALARAAVAESEGDLNLALLLLARASKSPFAGPVIGMLTFMLAFTLGNRSRSTTAWERVEADRLSDPPRFRRAARNATRALSAVRERWPARRVDPVCDLLIFRAVCSPSPALGQLALRLLRLSRAEVH